MPALDLCLNFAQTVEANHLSQTRTAHEQSRVTARHSLTFKLPDRAKSRGGDGRSGVPGNSRGIFYRKGPSLRRVPHACRAQDEQKRYKLKHDDMKDEPRA